MSLVMRCSLPDYDSETGTCAAPYWGTESGGFLPPLPVADALVLVSALLGLGALAYGLKFVRRYLWR